MAGRINDLLLHSSTFSDYGASGNPGAVHLRQSLAEARDKERREEYFARVAEMRRRALKASKEYGMRCRVIDEDSVKQTPMVEVVCAEGHAFVLSLRSACKKIRCPDCEETERIEKILVRLRPRFKSKNFMDAIRKAEISAGEFFPV